MLEVGNDEIIQAGQRARQQTPEARKIFNERIAEIAEAQPARMRNVIDETLGTQGKNASVAKIRDEAYQQAEPLFNEVRNIGDLAVNGDYLTAEQLNMRQPLIDQLNTGQYSDIPFGALPDNVRQQVNQIRISNGQNPLTADMIIPAGVVQKWGGNRMLENYSPERIAQIADEVFHSPDVKVSEGNYPHIQKLLKERPEHTNDFYGFVSQDAQTGKTTIKTAYEKTRSAKTGRQPVSLQDNSAGRMRLSDLQSTPYKKDIVQNNSKVNNNTPNLKRIAAFWNNYGRRYSPQYLTPYLAQYLANQQ